MGENEHTRFLIRAFSARLEKNTTFSLGHCPRLK
jgi:hypothetical protein